MAKVTVHKEADHKAETTHPADQNGEFTVTDDRGRVLKLKDMDFLDDFRLTEALGPLASNEAYYDKVFPILYLDEIDGDKILLPNSKKEVEALLKRLNRDGYKALTRGVVKFFAPKKTEGETNS